MQKAIKIFLTICITITLVHFYAAAQENKEAEQMNNKDNIKPTDQDRKKTIKIKNYSELVITATKSEINKKETGASITIITAEELEQKGKRNVADVLMNVPGLSVSKYSPLGGATQVYIRGADNNSIVVLIDGIKVNDPSQTGKGFDFAHLTTDNIERIEIIRGAQSTLYGSDAIGGVINIITKKGEGSPQLTIKAEGGSYSTFKEMIGINGSNDSAYYSFAASKSNSTGFSKAAEPKRVPGGFEKDGYDNTTLSTRVGIKSIKESWINFALRYTNANTAIDDGAYKDDLNRMYTSENLSAYLGYTMPVFTWWESNIILSYLSQLRRDKDWPDFISSTYSDMWFKGYMKKGEWKNKFMIGKIDEITAGAEIEEEKASTLPYTYSSSGRIPYGIDKTTYTKALYLQNHLKLLKRIFIITGIRYTNPDHFSSKINYALSGSFILPVIETRLKGNFQTGYKTPSLYQRYDTYSGNIYLRAETCISYDAGIEQPLFDNKVTLEANYFSMDYDRMISYDNFLLQYRNINAGSKGVECIISINPIDELSFNATYTYTKAINKNDNRPLLKRPKHKASFNLNYQFLEKGNINIGLIYVGERPDYTVYPYTAYMNAYYTLDVALSYWILDYLQIFSRADNLLGKKYEEVRGYKAAERGLYGGLKVVF